MGFAFFYDAENELFHFFAEKLAKSIFQTYKEIKGQYSTEHKRVMADAFARGLI